MYRRNHHPAGYCEIIDKDSSFASCFQEVRVLPPSESECIRFLVAHKEQYEKFHNVILLTMRSPLPSSSPSATSPKFSSWQRCGPT